MLRMKSASGFKVTRFSLPDFRAGACFSALVCMIPGGSQVAQARNMSASYATVEKYKDLYGRKTVYFRG